MDKETWKLKQKERGAYYKKESKGTKKNDPKQNKTTPTNESCLWFNKAVYSNKFISTAVFRGERIFEIYNHLTTGGDNNI